MQQASAKSYLAHFKDKKQKSSFRGEREIPPKIPCKLFFFETISALFPSSSLTCWINKPRCSQEYIPWYSHVLCLACTAGGDALLQTHRNPAGPIALQSDVPSALQRQQGKWGCVVFLRRGSLMDWNIFRDPEDLETQCLQKVWLLRGSSGRVHPGSLSFLATCCSFLVWHSAELKSGIWKTEKSPILIKTTVRSYYLTFLLVEFIGNSVSAYTHPSTVLVICLPAFLRYFPWLTPILFSVSLRFNSVTTWIWRKQQAHVLHTATLVPPSPSLVMPEYLIAPFNQPLWRALKQRIQQRHFKPEHKISGRVPAWDEEPNCPVPDMKKN